MDKQPIEDLFARRLRNAEVSPSANTWERIQAKQAKEEKRPFVTYWWYASAAACLVLIGLGSWWGSKSISLQQEQANTIAVVSKRKGVISDAPITKAKSTDKVESEPVLSASVVQNGNKQEKRKERDQTEYTHLASVANKERPVIAKTESLSRPKNIEPASIEPAMPAQTTAATDPSTERTLVINLIEPKVEGTSMESPQDYGKKEGLKGVMRRLKQLKDGELTDNETTEQLPTRTSAKANRSLLARLYKNVKESIQDENSTNR